MLYIQGDGVSYTRPEAFWAALFQVYDIEASVTIRNYEVLNEGGSPAANSDAGEFEGAFNIASRQVGTESNQVDRS